MTLKKAKVIKKAGTSKPAMSDTTVSAQENPLMSTLATAQNGCLPHAIHNFTNIGNKDGKYIVWLEGMLQKCHPLTSQHQQHSKNTSYNVSIFCAT